jgi:hypothetical protein
MSLTVKAGCDIYLCPPEKRDPSECFFKYPWEKKIPRILVGFVDKKDQVSYDFRLPPFLGEAVL